MKPLRFLSVCSGIEAISTAWHPLGFQAVAFSEIEPFPCKVLAHHYPDVPNLGDMSRFQEWPEIILSRVDVLVGGTPCQAFSVAGSRSSLADARGNLTLTFCHLYEKIAAVRHDAGRPAPILVWENVPGVLSTPDNAFGCFLGRLAGGNGPLRPPGGKWGNFGYVGGFGNATAWRTLDAQYFGLAQRRRRVFLVHSTRGGPDPEKVLFEWDGLRRDSAPRRQTWQGAARSAGAGPECGGVSAPLTTSPAADRPGRESLLIPCGIPDTARCVTTGEAKRQDWETCTILPCGETGAPIAFPAHMSATAVAATEDLSPSLCARNPTAVAFSGRARGDDGRGYDRPPQVFGDVAGCLETVKPHCVAYTLHGTDSTAVASPAEIHTCLGARPPGQAENSSTTVVATAFDLNQVTSPGNRSNPDPGSPCHTLPASALPPVVALSVALRGREGGATAELGGEVAHALRAAEGGGNRGHVLAFRACGQDGFQPRDLAPALTATDGGGTIPTVAHTLRGEGFDASEDGTGRGIPLVPLSLANLETACNNWHGNASEIHTTEKLRALRDKIGEKAFTEWGLGSLDSLRASEVLRTGMHGESLRRPPQQKHEMVNDPLPCPEAGQSGPVRAVRKGKRTGCSSPGRGPHEQPQHEPSADLPELPQQAPQAKEFLRALWKAGEGLGLLRHALSAVQEAWRPAQSQGEYAVRRLTPRECERLMGLPDDYTLIPGAGGWRALGDDEDPAELTAAGFTVRNGRVNDPDGPRYKALGNSMAVPVVAWIGRRLHAAMLTARGAPA